MVTVTNWSALRLHGFDQEETAQLRRRLRRGLESAAYSDAMMAEPRNVRELIQRGDMTGAFNRIAALTADLRVGLAPFASRFSDAKTAVATTNATVDMLRVVFYPAIRP